MDDTYWIKQTTDTPAFPDMIWSRPENKQARGKLLIIGGNSFGFSAVGEAYRVAEAAGIGTARVLLPNAIRKVVGLVLEHAEYGTSNPSGSFSQMALGEWLEQSAWADGVLIAGDLGKNSETAILIEKFLATSSTSVTVTKDAVNYFIPLAKQFANRPNTTLVLNMGQLQKLGIALGFTEAIRLGDSLVQLVEIIHEFSTTYRLEIVTKHLQTLLVAVNGSVSTTPLADDTDLWQVHTAAQTSVWRLQNPTKTFEALTTAVIPHT